MASVSAKVCLVIGFIACAIASPAFAAAATAPKPLQSLQPPQPWMDTKLGPDERAALIVAQMTQDEKLTLVRGWLGIPYRPNMPNLLPVNRNFHDIVGSAGYVPGIARLGIPSLQESDASLGVANLLGAMRPGDVATALPSSLALGSSFDPKIAYDGGAMIAHEAWSKGLNVLLGPGLNVIRDPRGGRNFEYVSEDPLLTGGLGAQFIHGVQDQHVVATAKHYAVNDQEGDRIWANAIIDESAMRESDLLAFELAIEDGQPGSVMCSYNLINGIWACNHNHLLNDILKGDWGYKGWVMSDWGAVHTVGSAVAGLDQESAAEADANAHFGSLLKQAVAKGTVPEARLTDMAQRIVRSMFAVGLFDHPATKTAIDYKADSDVALREAQEGSVLLKNDGHLLPLAQSVQHIAVIGGHADAGVLSGGGSSQVYPVGKPGTSIPIAQGDNAVTAGMNAMLFDPGAPLASIRANAPKTEIRFDPGNYPSQAAKLAKWADVVIVFATQWEREGGDLPDLTLPNGQDQLIDAMASANPRTIVVLETGTAIQMPWLQKAGAVLEVWYPGQRGGDAIASLLFGKADPSGHLPITFPQDENQLPHPVIPRSGAVQPEKSVASVKLPGNVFDVNYTEGAAVGYRWFAQKGLTPLFPFGFGLSYTNFEFSHLAIEGGQTLKVSFDVANTGGMAGSAVPQVYLTARAGESVQRLIGYSRVMLNPGQTQHVTLDVDPRLLADFDAVAHDWHVPEGNYAIMVGRSATDDVLTGSAMLTSTTLKP